MRAVRRDARQHEHARLSGARREWQPKIAAVVRRDHVQRGALRARQGGVRRRRASRPHAEQVRLVERDATTLRAAGREAGRCRQDAAVGQINQRARHAVLRLRRRRCWPTRTPGSCSSDRTISRAARVARVGRSKAAAAERKVAGKWAIVNTRSSVDPFLTFSERRDLRERVWKAFKSRGDNGDANDTRRSSRRSSSCAPSARSSSATRPTRTGGCPTRWRRTPDAAMALMMRVWPAAVARVKEEVADMQAIADREGAQHHDRAVGLPATTRRRSARRGTTSIRTSCKPYFELDNMIAASFWMADQLYGIRFKEITGKVPVFHPDVRVWEVTDVPPARTSASSTSTTSRVQASARARGRTRIATRATSTVARPPSPRTTTISSRARPASRCLISLDDAETLFHEFGHALHVALPEHDVSRARRHAARLRRVPVAGARALGADARGARQVRAPLPDEGSRCRRHSSTR